MLSRITVSGLRGWPTAPVVGVAGAVYAPGGKFGTALVASVMFPPWLNPASTVQRLRSSCADGATGGAKARRTRLPGRSVIAAGDEVGEGDELGAGLVDDRRGGDGVECLGRETVDARGDLLAGAGVVHHRLNGADLAGGEGAPAEAPSQGRGGPTRRPLPREREQRRRLALPQVVTHRLAGDRRV